MVMNDFCNVMQMGKKSQYRLGSSVVTNSHTEKYDHLLPYKADADDK